MKKRFAIVDFHNEIFEFNEETKQFSTKPAFVGGYRTPIYDFESEETIIEILKHHFDLSCDVKLCEKKHDNGKKMWVGEDKCGRYKEHYEFTMKIYEGLSI